MDFKYQTYFYLKHSKSDFKWTLNAIINSYLKYLIYWIMNTRLPDILTPGMEEPGYILQQIGITISRLVSAYNIKNLSNFEHGLPTLTLPY